MICIDSSEKSAPTPGEYKCANSQCNPKEDHFQGFGLAGGGYGTYTYCERCEKVIEKTQWAEDEA